MKRYLGLFLIILFIAFCSNPDAAITPVVEVQKTESTINTPTSTETL